MDNSNLDELQQAYKQAVDRWVAAIRTEEALATPDHSEVAMEQWDAAGFTEQDAQNAAKRARGEYKEALRLKHYVFSAPAESALNGRIGSTQNSW